MNRIPRDVQRYTPLGMIARTLGDSGPPTTIADTDTEKAFLKYALSTTIKGANADCVARTAAAWWDIDDRNGTGAPTPDDLQSYFTLALAWMQFAVRDQPNLGPDKLPAGNVSYQSNLLTIQWALIPWPSLLPFSAAMWFQIENIDVSWGSIGSMIMAKYDPPPIQNTSPVLVPWMNYPDIPWMTLPWSDIPWYAIPWDALSNQAISSKTILDAAAKTFPPKPNPNDAGPKVPPGGIIVHPKPGQPSTPVFSVPGLTPTPKPCPTGTARDDKGVCQPVCAPDQKLVNGHCVPASSSGSGTDTTKTGANASTGMSTGTKVAVGLGVTALAGAGLWLAFGKKRSKR